MKKLLFIAFLFFITGLKAQQAWTQIKGEGYFQIGTSIFNYSQLHNYTSSPIDIPRPISEFILSSYSEYGITDKLTATLVLPYHIVSSGDVATQWSGFAPDKGDLIALGNVNVGLTYNMYKKNNTVISSKLRVGLNTATFEATTGLRSGFNANEISPSILVGIGTYNYFASIETGINFLTNGYLHRYVLNTQIGTHLLESKRLLIIFGIVTSSTLGTSSSEDDLKLDENSKFTGLYVNQQAYYAIDLKLGYTLTKKLIVWSSIAGGLANNVGRNALYTFSIGYKLKKQTVTNKG